MPGPGRGAATGRIIGSMTHNRSMNACGQAQKQHFAPYTCTCSRSFPIFPIRITHCASESSKTQTAKTIACKIISINTMMLF